MSISEQLRQTIIDRFDGYHHLILLAMLTNVIQISDAMD